MDAIRLKNLRSLEDTGFIELKPITFLLGSNSSGKSTFLRSLALIRQSVTAKTTGPILWYGNLVDFGSFNEALNNKSDAKEICFTYKLKSSYLRRRRIEEDIDIILEMKVALEDDKQVNTVCKELVLNISDHTVKISIGSGGIINRFDVNDKSFLSEKSQFKSEQIGGILPLVFKLKDENNIDNAYLFPKRDPFFDDIVRSIKRIVHHKVSTENIGFHASLLNIESSSIMLAKIKETDVFKKKTIGWTEETEDYINLKNLIIANSIFSLLEVLDEYISSFAHNLSYIGPVRATAERYYRSQDLSVGEVDSEGKNLPMFLRNLTDNDRDDFTVWTEKYFNFSVIIHSSEDHVSLRIKENNSKTEINLADTGFGFSQVLPILTQLWWLGRRESRKGKFSSSYPVIFAIEQPELHLHPKLQSFLADFFIASVKAAKESGLNLKLIIETHSETLINRTGHRIANNECNADDINVVIFDKKNLNDSISIKTANYDAEGFLNNWPLGFFEPSII